MSGDLFASEKAGENCFFLFPSQQQSAQRHKQCLFIQPCSCCNSRMWKCAAGLSVMRAHAYSKISQFPFRACNRKHINKSQAIEDLNTSVRNFIIT